MIRLRRLLLLLALLLPAGAGLAVEADPTEQLRDPAQEALAQEIGRELRCLVCQNQSIEESNADLAHDLRRLVRERVAAGATREQVIAYLRDRYGDFILLRPPFTAVTALLWAAPALALTGGVAAILAARRRRAARSEPPDLTEAERARLAAIEAESPP